MTEQEKKKFWYVIKDYTDDDFSKLFEPRYEWRLYKADHKSVAENIAEDHFHQDPRNPMHFEPVIGVKDEQGVIKWFEISAEARVDFSAKEVSHDTK